MGKIVVVYATRTGHSRKLALAVAEKLGVKAAAVKEAAPPENTEAGLLFIAGGIYGGTCHPDIIKYVSKLDPDKIGKVVLITSSASVQCRSQAEVRKILEGKGIEIAEELTSPGNFLFLRLGHPGRDDIAGVADGAFKVAGSMGMITQ